MSHVAVRSILTRSSGFLTSVSSHSLQPYRGCSFGNSLCGQACYVRHNPFVTAGRAWGSFLEVKDNAAAIYARQYPRERQWARTELGAFSVFMSSSTEPFLPQEGQFGITHSILQEMLRRPPDLLILQTRSPRVADHRELLGQLSRQMNLRIHLTIESDRPGLLGLPPAASSVAARFAAARALREVGLRVVITVSPLLPIAAPEEFFAEIARSADAVVLDHFIGGDGSSLGSRTRRTALPEAMAAVLPESTQLAYRDAMAAIAERHLAGKVGVNVDGFAGRFL